MSAYETPLEYIKSVMPPKALNRGLGVYLTYVFAGHTSLDATAALVDLGGEVRQRELERSIRYNGALLRDVKVLAYALFHADQPSCRNLARSIAFTASARLSDEDVNLVRRAVAQWVDLRARLEFVSDRTDHLLSVDVCDRIIGRVLTDHDVVSYARRFVGKKMKFIWARNSGGKPMDEILADLTESAVFHLRRTFPYWTSPGHCRAIAKTAIHNRGHNLIKEHATASRKEVMQNTDGTYCAVSISLSAEQASFLLGQDAPASSLDGSTTSQEELDNRISLAQLASNPDFSQRQRHFIRLMSGTYDAHFSSFLGASDNSAAAVEWSHDDYLTGVCRYLQVPPERGRAFLTHLRTYL